MDAHRFDTLFRSLTSAGSRRHVFGPLSGVAFGVLGSVLAAPRAEARKRHKKRNGAKKSRGKDCPPCETCSEPPPAPTCTQTCGNCPTCFTQAAGTLLCADTSFLVECDRPCTSDNQCLATDRPYCLLHFQARGSTENFLLCEEPGGHCGAIFDPC
jgi:hypothetical protein